MTVEGFGSAPLPMPQPRFCTECGGPVTLRELASEDRPRHVCVSCGHVHYVNPKVVGAVVPVHEGRVLLFRRACEPRVGTWVFPGGFVEWGETTEEAATREAEEEAGLAVAIGRLLGVYSRLGPGVVIVVYLGTVTDPRVTLGWEALESAWFTPEEIPWADLAFDTTEEALRAWLGGR